MKAERGSGIGEVPSQSMKGQGFMPNEAFPLYLIFVLLSAWPILSECQIGVYRDIFTSYLVTHWPLTEVF